MVRVKTVMYCCDLQNCLAQDTLLWRVHATSGLCVEKERWRCSHQVRCLFGFSPRSTQDRYRCNSSRVIRATCRRTGVSGTPVRIEQHLSTAYIYTAAYMLLVVRLVQLPRARGFLDAFLDLFLVSCLPPLRAIDQHQRRFRFFACRRREGPRRSRPRRPRCRPPLPARRRPGE